MRRARHCDGLGICLQFRCQRKSRRRFNVGANGKAAAAQESDKASRVLDKK
jgi:hypothetical protein